MLNVEIISCLNDNYSYVINDTETDLVGVIDPAEFSSIDKFISIKHKRLDYILNTHHHYDHVGGNTKLKKKYSSKVVGFEIDKNKIPNIDIVLSENQEFKFGKTIFKIIFVPGHTKGHVAFYSQKEKLIFTGDTLFSLGCGRVFEGTYEEMYSSINKIKNLPKDTKIYCGHEYTLSNFKFCFKFDNNNNSLIRKKKWLDEQIYKNLPTIPITLGEELNTNIFLRCDNNEVKNNLKMSGYPDELIFQKLRNLKDKF